MECQERTIIPMITSSLTTAHMCFLTASRLYVLYPSITRHGLALTGEEQLNRQISGSLAYKGFLVSDDLVYGRRKCGFACKKNWRDAYGLKGACWLPWGMLPEASSIMQTKYLWRLSPRCSNWHCINYDSPSPSTLPITYSHNDTHP